MFSSIFLKSLRDSRAGVLAWGLGLALVLVASVAAYPQVVSGTGAAREQAAAEMAKAFQAFSFLVGQVTSVTTIGGYITVRLLGLIPLLVAVWVIIAAVGLTRGEEQKGTQDVLLATPQNRTSALLQKALALYLAIFICTVLLGLGLWLGSVAAGEPVDVAGLLLASLNILALLLFWASAALLAGQFTQNRRTASSAVGGLLFGTYLLNNIFETTPGLSGLAWLMPAHYYSLSKPLAPGSTFQWGAWLVLMALTAVCLGLSIFLYNRRDIGASVRLLPARNSAAGSATRTSSGPLLTSVFAKSVRDLIALTLYFGIGLALYGLVLVGTASAALGPVRQIVQQGGWVAKLLGNMASDESYLSYAFFLYMPVLLAVFAIMQIGSWAEEEEEGRLDITVATPVWRWQVLFARYVAMTLSLVAIQALTGIAMLAAAPSSNVSLDAGRLLGALAAALPLPLIVAAFGLFVATWSRRPQLAVPVTIALVTIMFILETLAPIFDFPEGVRDLSIFHLYGNPLVSGINWGGLAALCVGTALFAAASLSGVMRRDIDT